MLLFHCARQPRFNSFVRIKVRRWTFHALQAKGPRSLLILSIQNEFIILCTTGNVIVTHTKVAIRTLEVVSERNLCFLYLVGFFSLSILAENQLSLCDSKSSFCKSWRNTANSVKTMEQSQTLEVVTTRRK